MWISRGGLLTYLVVQHGEGGEALQDARLKEIEEDPHHGHFRAAAFCTQRNNFISSFFWIEKPCIMYVLVISR